MRTIQWWVDQIGYAAAIGYMKITLIGFDNPLQKSQRWEHFGYNLKRGKVNSTDNYSEYYIIIKPQHASTYLLKCDMWTNKIIVCFNRTGALHAQQKQLQHFLLTNRILIPVQLVYGIAQRIGLQIHRAHKINIQFEQGVWSYCCYYVCSRRA